MIFSAAHFSFVKGVKMINPLQVVKSVPSKITNALVPAKQLYLDNASTVNAIGAISFSCLSTATAIRNSAEILETIADIKAIYPTIPDQEHRKEFIKAGIKKLFPLISPIVAFQAAAITFIMLNKNQLDKANKKIADLTAALVVANNAISQYQEFQKKAEEELKDKKTAKIKTEMAEEHVKENPKTEANTFNAPYANQNYLYWSVNSKRYINSDKSPVEIENFCKKSAYDLKDGNFFNDEFTYADIYDFMGPKLVTDEHKYFGWNAKDVMRSGNCDSSAIRIDIIPSELDDHQTLCYDLTFHGHRLFN